MFLLPFRYVRRFKNGVKALYRLLQINLTVMGQGVSSITQVHFPYRLANGGERGVNTRQFYFPREGPLTPNSKYQVRLLSHPINSHLPKEQGLRQRNRGQFRIQLIRAERRHAHPIKGRRHVRRFIPTIGQLVIYHGFSDRTVLSIYRLSYVSRSVLILGHVESFPAVRRG